MHKIKLATEISNLKTAASFVEWSFRKVNKEIENVIEGDIVIKHSKISGSVEHMLENPDKINQFLNKNGLKDAD